jgi:hypothetical protein
MKSAWIHTVNRKCAKILADIHFFVYVVKVCFDNLISMYILMVIVYQCFQFPFYPFLNTISLALKINTQCSVTAREFVKNHIFIRSVIFYSFKIELFF